MSTTVPPSQGPSQGQTQGPSQPTSYQSESSYHAVVPVPRNSKVFSIVLIITQIALIVLFAIFVRPEPTIVALDNGLVQTIGTALIVLIGFGLYFSYMRSYSWSGIGFTLLIVGITLQFYVLVNAFWSKARLQYSNTNWSDTHIRLFLNQQDRINSTVIDTLGNTIIGGLKCALSMSIIFAAIGGRGGPLECLIIVIIGTITYELNRQVISLFSVNFGGSTNVFQFGGVAGSILAILLRVCRQSDIVDRHPEHTSNKQNATIALLGAAFIWVFFPNFNMDVSDTLFVFSSAGISTLYCVSTCVAVMIGLSLLLGGKLSYRDVITAPIAGGVIVGSSSSYMHNPLEAIILGTIAGVVQIIFNRLQKALANNPLWSNGVLSLFAFQGLLGGLASAVFRAVNKTVDSHEEAYRSLPARYAFDQRGQISATFVTLGIAAITGLILFLIIMCVTNETREDLYHDRAYWHIHEDDISYGKNDEPDVQFAEGVKDFDGEYL